MKYKKECLVKLIEECGELQHIIGKKLLNDNTKTYKLEDEIADVLAASIRVIDVLNLNRDRIEARVHKKLEKHFSDSLIIDIETGRIYD